MQNLETLAEDASVDGRKRDREVTSQAKKVGAHLPMPWLASTHNDVGELNKTHRKTMIHHQKSKLCDCEFVLRTWIWYISRNIFELEVDHKLLCLLY